MSLATKFCRKAALVSLALDKLTSSVENAENQYTHNADMTQLLALQSTKLPSVLNQKHVQHLQPALGCAVAYADMCCRAHGNDGNTIQKTS